MKECGEEFEAAFSDFARTQELDRKGVDVKKLRDFILEHAVPKQKIDEVFPRLVELLAAIEHQRWAHWQQYQHSKCAGDSEGTGALVIPSELVRQWEHQIATPYQDLSEAEKESDREQVRRYLPLIRDELVNR
jgi:hypothetical protein